MKISFQISFIDSTEKQEMFKEIKLSEAISLFGEFDWDKAQNKVSKKLANGETIDDTDSIILKNSDNIKLSIESFDREIYVVALFREKRMQFRKIPELINGSPKLRQSDVVEIIQSFFANDFKHLNNLCDKTRENSEFEIGPNAILIEQQANQYINNLQIHIRKNKINKSISKLSFGSWYLIGLGLFLIYILEFKLKGNNYLLKGFMLVVSGILIWFGTRVLMKIKKQKNN